MTSEQHDYVAARLIEEREAIANATTPQARKAHQELAARYAQMLNALGPQAIAPASPANVV